MEVRLVPTTELGGDELQAIRSLLDTAFEAEFGADDWAHALGGLHALVTSDGELIAHGAVVERTLEVDGVRRRTGYVEGVATAAGHRRRGAASAAMRALGDVIAERFELGALSTGEWRVYERSGWERWRGTTAVRRQDGTIEPTPDDDDGVMVLRTPTTAQLDLTGLIVCDDRPGDVW